MQYGEQRLELTKVEDGKFITKDSSGQTVTWTNEWNELERLSPRTGFPEPFIPHSMSFSFPLWEGKKWSGSYQVGRFIRNFMNAEVKRWEPVTVPAGKFDAIRVELRPAGVVATCWYAIEAQHPIKCESNIPSIAFELVKFELK